MPDLASAERTVTRLFVATDARDWDAVRGCFADEVVLDMESLSGQPPAPVPAGVIVESWDENLGNVTHVHHQVGNLLSERDGDRAIVTCHGVAYHYREVPSGENVRRFVGTYRFGLDPDGDGWRVGEMRFACKFIDGNLNLESE
jgi:hypothetical protein